MEGVTHSFRLDPHCDGCLKRAFPYGADRVGIADGSWWINVVVCSKKGDVSDAPRKAMFLTLMWYARIVRW